MAISRRVSIINQRLKVGPMKRLYPFYTPNAINLAGGVPMESTFPIESMQVNLINNESIMLTKGKNLSLNYLRGDGMPVLREWVKNHMQQLHNPLGDMNSCVTIGSTDALTKSFQLLNGNCVLFDEYAYGPAVASANVYGRNCVGVKMDSQGMLPDDLKRQTLLAREKGLDPDTVYLVPTAQNPTGLSMSQARKEAIYRTCQELDLIILEDDAYYYLYHGEQSTTNGNITSSQLPGIRNLPRSFLSLDTDERVIRMDSLSKFICPGIRLGWISGPTSFTDKYLLLQEISSQFPSGISQSVFYGIVNSWGDDKLHSHVQEIQAHYLRQRNFMCNALHSSLGSISLPASPSSSTLTPAEPFYSFAIPDGGMFLFLKFPYHYLPLTSEELFKKLASSGVIIVPGDDFHVPGLQESTPSSSVSSSSSISSMTSSGLGLGKIVPLRLTYAASQPEAIQEGISRLSRGVENILTTLSKKIID